MTDSHTPTSTETNTDAHMSVHRWPWRTEEFVSMAVAFAIVIGFGYLVLALRSQTMTGAIALGWIAFTVVAAFGSVYYLYRVKKKRTDTSQVTVTIRGTLVRSESKGPLGTSQIDVAKTETFSHRKFGSDETFMISDGNKTLRIPFRAAAADPKIREVVETAYATAERKSVEGRDLLFKLQGKAAADTETP